MEHLFLSLKASSSAVGKPIKIWTIRARLLITIAAATNLKYLDLI